MNEVIKTDGIDLYFGDADAAAASISTHAGYIQAIGDIGGFTGGEKLDATRKNQVLQGGGEDVVKRSLPKKISMAPLSFTLGCGDALGDYAAVAAIVMQVKAFKITFPDAPSGGTPTTIHGNGFITECKLAGGGDDVLVNVTIEPTGDAWTVTAAAGA